MNSQLFDNQVAIVTGAGQGIGFEIAKQLASQGACVILNDADKSLAADAARKIRNKEGECVAFAGDASILISSTEWWMRLSNALANSH
jgi:glucose 1-dehydrogenase